MDWHKFTAKTYRVMMVVFLLIIVGGYVHACVTGESFGVTSSTFRG